MHRLLRKREHIIYCAICIYIKTGIAAPAVTIMGGTALCNDHMGYAHDKTVIQAIIDSRNKD